MKVIIDGNKVRIIGKNHGSGDYGKYIQVYVSEDGSEDRYSMSTIDGPMEIGNLPSVTVSKSNIVIQSNLPQGKSFVR